MTSIDKFFSGMRAAASGMAAERLRVDTVARNIANANTTRTPEGGPYRRQLVHFGPLLQRAADGRQEVVGVRVLKVAADEVTPLPRIFDPSHSDADGQGYVTLPNVNPVMEMADLIAATRAYEANVSAQEQFVAMAERALRLVQS
ncbi:MAG: flagellar basal body rod protein FlgC [Planctomycetes bacterium]|jgi:flagellar basal-body rod protein FlgC|nr:flagellar basal body rod protein FlgC [Planctomycetota bacterium]